MPAIATFKTSMGDFKVSRAKMSDRGPAHES